MIIFARCPHLVPKRVTNVSMEIKLGKKNVLLGLEGHDGKSRQFGLIYGFQCANNFIMREYA